MIDVGKPLTIDQSPHHGRQWGSNGVHRRRGIFPGGPQTAQIGMGNLGAGRAPFKLIRSRAGGGADRGPSRAVRSS
eukprot:11585285-Heterocapsa_arctica.AAC.1